MTQQVINRGTSPGDGTGDNGYVAFGKVNSNFTELYGGAGTTGLISNKALNLSGTYPGPGPGAPNSNVIGVNSTLTGNVPNSISYAPFFLQVTSTNFSKSVSPITVPAMQVDHFFGGSGDLGLFAGVSGLVHQTAQTGNKAAGNLAQFTGGIFGASARDTEGGTAGAGNGYGAIFGSNVFSQLLNGATNWHGCIGQEIDVSVATGANTDTITGLSVVFVPGHATSGGIADYSIAIGNGNNTVPGWDYGLSFGFYDGYWPMKSTGTLIGAWVHGSTTNTGTAGTTTNGVDFSNVTFTGSAYKSTGFSVDGSGNTVTKTVKTTPVTVAGLPAAATAGQGARAFVTDATVATFNSAATGGGTNKVPVFSDGTSWLIG